jgi:hypothetical protein
VRHDYVNTVCDAFCNADSSESEREELRSLISETLKDASDQIHPLIDKAWNEYIVNILTTKCAGPLAGVRGVAATYRMTNRPPPTQASPFVGSILRPLKEFEQSPIATLLPSRNSLQLCSAPKRRSRAEGPDERLQVA